MTDNTASAPLLDLDDFEDVTSADLRIKHPETGAPTSVTITLAGPEHPDRKRILFARQRRMRNQLQKTGKLQLQDPADDEIDETDLLAACTLGWSGIVVGGQPVVYSPQAALAIYGNPKRRWLRDQVKAALDERELFIKRCAAA